MSGSRDGILSSLPALCSFVPKPDPRSCVIWGKPTFCPEWKCLAFIPNLIFNHCRYTEAKKVYNFLETADTRRTSGAHSTMASMPRYDDYINWRFNVPAVYHGLKDYKGCEAYLRATERAHFSRPSATNVKNYTRLLLSFIQGIFLWGCEIGLTFIGRNPDESFLMDCFGNNSHVAEFLLELRNEPPTDTVKMCRLPSITAAMAYVKGMSVFNSRNSTEQATKNSGKPNQKR